MDSKDRPLIIEYHEEYEDAYIWNGLPGGWSRLDLYFFVGLEIISIILLILQGETNLTIYALTIAIMLLIAALYKGIKVGIDSIAYRRWESPYRTRIADEFIIWASDDPVLINKDMNISVRPPSSDQAGVVYLYHGSNRHICFLSQDVQALRQFAKYLNYRYDLNIVEDTVE